MTENKSKPVNLGSAVVGEVKGGIDVSSFIGRKAKIEKLGEYEGQFGYYIKVETNSLETIEAGNGETIEIRASRIFGLQADRDNPKAYGWTKNSKLAVFLAKMKCKHYRELVGKEVTVQTRTADDGTEYLTF